MKRSKREFCKTTKESSAKKKRRQTMGDAKVPHWNAAVHARQNLLAWLKKRLDATNSPPPSLQEAVDIAKLFQGKTLEGHPVTPTRLKSYCRNNREAALQFLLGLRLDDQTAMLRLNEPTALRLVDGPPPKRCRTQTPGAAVAPGVSTSRMDYPPSAIDDVSHRTRPPPVRTRVCVHLWRIACERQRITGHTPTRMPRARRRRGSRPSDHDASALAARAEQ
jgi:hypothetical protein